MRRPCRNGGEVIEKVVTDGQITCGLCDVSNSLGYHLVICMKKMDLLKKLPYHLSVTRASPLLTEMDKG